ncbi:hypothetical protein [Shigella dysenteriae]|nr:hypothetical protein [Shigella dysenteriae]VDG92164.1 Uncharacterised protein [Shigella dysenteriae]
MDWQKCSGIKRSYLDRLSQKVFVHSLLNPLDVLLISSPYEWPFIRNYLGLFSF